MFCFWTGFFTIMKKIRFQSGFWIYSRDEHIGFWLYINCIKTILTHIENSKTKKNSFKKHFFLVLFDFYFSIKSQNFFREFSEKTEKRKIENAINEKEQSWSWGRVWPDIEWLSCSIPIRISIQLPENRTAYWLIAIIWKWSLCKILRK